jgi:hypothetical protein
MATNRQIAANRRNSQLSTGPTSVTGKAVSRMNALKSGIDSTAEIIRNESQEELDALKKEYYDEHNPTTPEERDLVDILIRSGWTLRRLARIETQMFDNWISDRNAAGGWVPKKGKELGEAYQTLGRTLERLQIRINATQRNFQRALKDLKQLQSQTIQTTCEELASFQQIPASEPEPAPEPVIEPQKQPLATAKNPDDTTPAPDISAA